MRAFAILDKVARALRRTTPTRSTPFMAEATAGDYDQLLQTTMRWVEVS